eukprot:2503544-Prymnesium_polylepis.1
MRLGTRLFSVGTTRQHDRTADGVSGWPLCRARTAPRPAAAPDDRPLAQAHVPVAPTHRPAQHPVVDTPTLEPASRHRRGR